MSVTVFLFFLYSWILLYAFFFPQWASISCKAGLGLVSKYLGFLNVCLPSLFYFVVWRIPHDGHGVYRLYVQQRVDCILHRCLAQLWLREANTRLWCQKTPLHFWEAWDDSHHFPLPLHVYQTMWWLGIMDNEDYMWKCILRTMMPSKL